MPFLAGQRLSLRTFAETSEGTQLNVKIATGRSLLDEYFLLFKFLSLCAA